MSSSPLALQLDRVSKRYRAGRSRTVVDLIASTIDSLRGEERDVYSVARGRIDSTVWALRDVSFDIPEGAGVGIIGANGAGKTTLLKLISRVTWPTSGRVRAYGAAGEIAEQYMHEVNLQTLANDSTALQSHRGGTGEIRYAAVDLFDGAGRPATSIDAGASLLVRAT